MHRPNPLRKRKVWMEMYDDMIVTFRSGGDEEKVKPVDTFPRMSLLHLFFTTD
jgi:hypothetical protein